jgi:hypothetical protein
MFRCCGAQSTLKLRENPNRRGFAGYSGLSGKSLGQAFVIRQRMQIRVIRYIIAVDLNGCSVFTAPTQDVNTYIAGLFSPSFQETP